MRTQLPVRLDEVRTGKATRHIHTRDTITMRQVLISNRWYQRWPMLLANNLHRLEMQLVHKRAVPC